MEADVFYNVLSLTVKHGQLNNWYSHALLIAFLINLLYHLYMSHTANPSLPKQP